MLALQSKGLAILFPGQGSQYVGMARKLADNFPKARLLLQSVDEALGFGLSRLMHSGPEAELTRTENAQPAILAASIAHWSILTEEFGWNPPKDRTVLLGHSLGEYSALVAAKTMPLLFAVKLVRARALAMQKAMALANDSGQMLALIVREDKMDRVLARMEELAQTHPTVGISAINSSTQLVISGGVSSIDAISRSLRDEQLVEASRALRVSAPFHSPLMRPAALALEKTFKEAVATFQTPKWPVISNVTAAPHDGIYMERIADRLLEQVAGTIKWHQSIQYCRNQKDVRVFAEMAPGRVLTGLMRSQPPGTISLSLDSPEQSLHGFVSAMTHEVCAEK